MENELNLEEYESILDSIDKSSADDNYDDKCISPNNLEDIWDVSYVHQNINTRGDRL